MAGIKRAPKTEDRGSEQAWLFQFRDDQGGQARTTEWQASRWSKDMRAGDLVFFWQSGSEGGLAGWGQIASEASSSISGPGRGIQVVERFWLSRAVPRDDVLAANAILSTNLLRGEAEGTNFSLSMEEAEKLAQFFPAEHRPTAGAAEHRGAPKPKEMSDEVDRNNEGLMERLRELGIPDASPLAKRVLRRAAGIRDQRDKDSQITSTRLLIIPISLAPAEPRRTIGMVSSPRPASALEEARWQPALR